MNRRGVLVSIGLTAFSRVAYSLSKPLLHPSKLAHASFAPADTQSEHALDERLRQDLARLEPRVDSEEGVAVFLACENLVSDKTSKEPPQVTLTATNRALASAIHRNAEAWLRIRPDAKAKDVAQLIEVLAARDFASGGTVEER